MLDRDVITTDHWQEVILVYGLSNSSNHDDLECPWRSFPRCVPFQGRYFVFVARRAVPLHLQSFLSWWRFLHHSLAKHFNYPLQPETFHQIQVFRCWKLNVSFQDSLLVTQSHDTLMRTLSWLTVITLHRVFLLTALAERCHVYRRIRTRTSYKAALAHVKQESCAIANITARCAMLVTAQSHNTHMVCC